MFEKLFFFMALIFIKCFKSFQWCENMQQCEEKYLPVTTLLTSKTLEMIHIGPGSHHHLECWDHLVTRGAVASGAKQPGQTHSEREQRF